MWCDGVQLLIAVLVNVGDRTNNLGQVCAPDNYKTSISCYLLLDIWSHHTQSNPLCGIDYFHAARLIPVIDCYHTHRQTSVMRLLSQRSIKTGHKSLSHLSTSVLFLYERHLVMRHRCSMGIALE